MEESFSVATGRLLLFTDNRWQSYCPEKKFCRIKVGISDNSLMQLCLLNEEENKTDNKVLVQDLCSKSFRCRLSRALFVQWSDGDSVMGIQCRSGEEAQKLLEDLKKAKNEVDKKSNNSVDDKEGEGNNDNNKEINEKHKETNENECKDEEEENTSIAAEVDKNCDHFQRSLSMTEEFECERPLAKVSNFSQQIMRRPTSVKRQNSHSLSACPTSHPTNAQVMRQLDEMRQEMRQLMQEMRQEMRQEMQQVLITMTNFEQKLSKLDFINKNDNNELKQEFIDEKKDSIVTNNRIMEIPPPSPPPMPPPMPPKSSLSSSLSSVRLRSSEKTANTKTTVAPRLDFASELSNRLRNKASNQ